MVDVKFLCVNNTPFVRPITISRRNWSLSWSCPSIKHDSALCLFFANHGSLSSITIYTYIVKGFGPPRPSMLMVTAIDSSSSHRGTVLSNIHVFELPSQRGKALRYLVTLYYGIQGLHRELVKYRVRLLSQDSTSSEQSDIKDIALYIRFFSEHFMIGVSS